MDNTKTYRVTDEPKYIIPSEFVFGSQDLTSNQKKLLGFILLFVKQLRDKMYENDEKHGKKSTHGMTQIEKNKHFNHYYPELKDIKKENNFLLLEWHTLEKFFDMGNHPKRYMTPVITGIMGKVSQFYDPVDNEEIFLTVIPLATISEHGVKIEVHHRAIQRLCKHSLGFSDTDLQLWLSLKSQHSLKLLEILSINKNRTYDHEIFIDDLKRALSCDYKTASKVQAKKLKVKYGSYLTDDDGNKIPKYSTFSDFNKIVLKRAFKEIVDNSDGVWIADPEFPLGYELVKSGKKVNKIRIKLRHVDTSKKINKKIDKDLSFDEMCSKLPIEELKNFMTYYLTETLDFDKLKSNKKYSNDVIQVVNKYESFIAAGLIEEINPNAQDNIRTIKTLLNL